MTFFPALRNIGAYSCETVCGSERKKRSAFFTASSKEKALQGRSTFPIKYGKMSWIVSLLSSLPETYVSSTCGWFARIFTSSSTVYPVAPITPTLVLVMCWIEVNNNANGPHHEAAGDLCGENQNPRTTSN